MPKTRKLNDATIAIYLYRINPSWLDAFWDLFCIVTRNTRCLSLRRQLASWQFINLTAINSLTRKLVNSSTITLDGTLARKEGGIVQT